MQQIGLEAVFLTAAFAKGLDVYIKGTKKAQDATVAVASVGNIVGANFGGVMGTGLQVASVGFGILGSAAIAATAAIAAGVVAATHRRYRFYCCNDKFGIEREQKYKAKQAIDTFFVRSGDLLSAAVVFVGTHHLALGPAGFAATNVAVVLLALFVGTRLVAEYNRLTAPGRG